MRSKGHQKVKRCPSTSGQKKADEGVYFFIRLDSTGAAIPRRTRSPIYNGVTSGCLALGFLRPSVTWQASWAPWLCVPPSRTVCLYSGGSSSPIFNCQFSYMALTFVWLAPQTDCPRADQPIPPIEAQPSQTLSYRST